MGFLRQNIFVLGLIGVVLVVGGVMLAMDISASGDTRDQIDRRTKLSDELKSAAGDPVNDGRLRAEQPRVNKVKTAAEKVAGLSARWNRGSYRVMELPILNPRGVVIKRVNAFPMDQKNRAPRVLVLTSQYPKELQAILNRLNATQPPDDAEIARETSFFHRPQTDRDIHPDANGAPPPLPPRQEGAVGGGRVRGDEAASDGRGDEVRRGDGDEGARGTRGARPPGAPCCSTPADPHQRFD